MASLEQVFYHELGHFIANELNRIHYSGLGVASITIQPCNENPREFCGGAKPIAPADYNENEKKAPPIERLAEYLARVIHGCIFQSYYQQISLDGCLRDSGKSDQAYWNGALIENKLFGKRSNFFEIQDNYKNYLQKNKFLANFMSLKPNDYLTETDLHHYSVNLEKLSLDTQDAIEDYFPNYKVLVDNYQNAITQKDLE
jgi:hypothetical protein